MSFSTAFQSLRLPARSRASNQLFRSAAVSASAPVQGRTSSSNGDGRRPSHATRSRAPAASAHAPHGQLDEGVAGPSRCFCTSNRHHKASELPLEAIHYHGSLDTYRHDQLSTPTTNYWQPTESSSRSVVRPAESHALTRRLPTHFAPSTTHPTAPPPTIQTARATNHDPSFVSSRNDFFTPSVQQESSRHIAPDGPPSPSDSVHVASLPAPPTFLESLGATQTEALDHRVRMLIRSGEHSMSALSAEYGELRASDREQVCCHILSQRIKESEDARVVWDLYRSWPSEPHVALSLPPGPMRNQLRRMQSDVLYRCVTYLHAARLDRQAAVVVVDARLKASQSRYLFEQLIYDFKLPRNPTAPHPAQLSTVPGDGSTDALPQGIRTDTFAAVDARLAVREMCDAMTQLMADGVSFKRKTLNRALKLLCATRARSRVVRLVRAAQRRAQIDRVTVEIASQGERALELRAAGGFSRLRIEEKEPPQVVSTKVVEESIRMLSAQDASGARTAYELLCVLDPAQRSADMYDALMTAYGNAPITSIIESGPSGCNEPGSGYVSVDEQLWRDVCTLPHLAGPTVHTISARIVCHARSRRLDLIKADLAFLRESQLGTLHDVTDRAKLSIVRCYIESGSLLGGFRYARMLLTPTFPSEDVSFATEVVNTLLKAAQRIQIAPVTPRVPRAAAAVGRSGRSGGGESLPSRAQLLKRFFRHFTHLHRRFPHLQPGVETLRLFVQLLDRHQQWIESATLWGMLRVVGRHFGKQDQRLVRVLDAFATVFESRGEQSSADELRALVQKLKTQTDSA